MKHSFTRWSLLLILSVLGKLTAFAQLEPHPHLIADDIITFAEGEVDPNNPDIWVIEMGDPTLLSDSIYIQLNREKGLEADYAVTLNAYLRCGNDDSFDQIDWPAKEGIRIEAGETTIRVGLEISRYITKENLEVAFVYFASCSRTKTAQSLLQLNFTPTRLDPVEHTNNLVRPTVGPPLIIGQYLIFRTSFSGDVAIANDQTLRLKEWRGTTLDDAVESDEITLTPIRSEKTSKQSFYLHKLTEEMTLAGKYSSYGRPVPSYNFKLTGIDNLKDANQNPLNDRKLEYYLEKTSILLSDSGKRFFQAPPRIERLEVSKSSYSGKEQGRITAYIPNMDYYMRHNLRGSVQDALANMSITLFGVDRRFSEDQWNPDTKEATLLFEVPENTSEADSTVFAEIKVWTLNRVEGQYYGEYVYPYGAYTSFTHARGIVDFEHPIESIEVRGLPENNLIFRENTYVDYPTYQLRAVVSPTEAMSEGKWTSSNTEVATIDENTGLLTPIKDGAVTIRFTSNEVARRAELGLDPNDEVLIREIKLIVGGVEPKLQIQPQFYRYEVDSAVINFHHNFKYAGWTPVKAEMTITGTKGDTKYNETIDVNLDDLGFDNGLYQYILRYNENLTKEYSDVDEKNNFLPTYWVELSVELKRDGFVNKPVEISYPVYVAFPVKPEIRITEEKLQEFYEEGVKNSVTYEISRLDLHEYNGFTIDYTIKGFTVDRVDDSGNIDWGSPVEIASKKISASDFPTEVVDNLSRTGSLVLEYTPLEPISEFDYTEIQLIVNNQLKNATAQYVHTTQIKNKKTGQLIASFKSINSDTFADAKERPNNGITMEALDNDYNSDDLYTHLQKNWPSQIFSFSYPKAWGVATLKLDDGSHSYAYGVNHISTFRLDYPLRGGKQTLTISWGEDREPQTYTYTFDNIENKIYGYFLSGYKKEESLFVEYTTGEGSKKTRDVTCTNGYLCIYEPEGIQGSIFIRGTHPWSQSLVYCTITNAQPISSGSVFKATNSFDKFINESRVLAVKPDFQIQLYDASGKKVTTPSTINYVTLDKANQVISQGYQTGNDGKFAFALESGKSIFDNANYTQYVEILADGYQPQLLVSNQSDSYRMNVIMKGTEREDKHANVKLTEKGQKKSLYNHSLNDVVGFSDADKNVLLNLWLPYEKTDTYAVSDFELLGGIGSARKATAGRIITNENFKYNYAELPYNIDNFIGKQATAALSVRAKGKTLTKLPTLKNNAIDQAQLRADIEKDLELDLAPGGTDVGDLDHIQGTGKFDDAFKNFDMTLPSMLPVTLQIVRNDNEYILRGIYSQNFIPGGEKIDEYLEAAADFEALFNEIRSQLREGKKYEGSNRYLSGGAFVGFRGFVAGKATYNPNKSGVPLDFAFEDIGIKGEISANFNAEFAFIIVVGLGINGELSSELKFAKPSKEEVANATNPVKINLVLTNTVALDLYAKLGLGINILLAEYTVGVKGGGGGSHKHQIIFKPYSPNKVQFGFQTNIYAYIEVWRTKRFLFWSSTTTEEIANWEKTFNFPNNANNPFLAETTRSVSRVGDVYTRAEIPELTTTIKDVSDNAKPQYIDGGNTLVYNDIQDPNNYNDDRVMTHTSSSSSSSEVLDSRASGPAYNLSAASAGEKSIIAYEEGGQVDSYDLETLEDAELLRLYSSKVNIMASLNEGEPTNLSADNEGTDMANMKPKAAVNDNHAGVVWTSGSLDVDEEMSISMEGHLMLARHDGTDGTEWTKHRLLPINKENTFGAYSIAMATDGTALIAIENIEGKEATIQVISVTKDGTMTVVDTGKKGHAPILKALGGKFILSFLSTKDTGEEDLYFSLIGKDGTPDGVSGFAGMSKKMPHNYQLLVKEDGTKIADVSVVWSESDANGTVSIVAARLGLRNNEFYASQPTKVLDIPTDARLYSYDGYYGNKLKIAACVGNENLGAVIVEEEIEYTNDISLLADNVPYSQVAPGETISIGFQVGNDGFLPIKSLKVAFGDQETTINTTIMPGYSEEIKASYKVPATLAPVTYTITAEFEDNSEVEYTNKEKLDLTTVDLKAELLSQNTKDGKSTILVDVINNSKFPLTGSEDITVGLYTDLQGEELYLGTTVQSIAAGELYKDNENQSVVVSFEINKPTESLSLYAIVKTEGVRDLNTMDNSAIIPFFIETRQDPSATYYTVSIPEVEGVKIDPSKDAVVQENGSLTITVTALEGYTLQDMVFYVNGVEMTPTKVLEDGRMMFTISPITGDVIITITGVNKGTVSNIVLIDGMKMYTEPGYLVIDNKRTSDNPDNIVIYTIQGKLLVKQELPTGVTRIPVDSGVYLIVINGQSYKVYIQ